MQSVRSRRWRTVASALAYTAATFPAIVFAQADDSRSAIALLLSPAVSAHVDESKSAMPQIVSPAVVATWYDKHIDGVNFSREITLLVLWRGTPGWFLRKGPSARSKSGVDDTAMRGPYTSRESFAYGDLSFTIEIDDAKQIARIVNQEISLRKYNVVLVDFVDSVAGATIVGYRWVEPHGFPVSLMKDGPGNPVATVLADSLDLYDFLRCETSRSVRPDGTQPFCEAVALALDLSGSPRPR